MVKRIQKRRDEFIIGIIKEFKDTDNSKTYNECYKYVNKLSKLHINDFLNTLNEAEKTFIKNNNYKILCPLKDINTFVIFMNNNNIYFNQ